MHSQGAGDVILIGLGTIAETHLRVLERLPHVEVVAGVDVDGARKLFFRGHELPVYPDVRAAAHKHAPAIVVVTTPTPTHAAVCADVAAYLPDVRLLVEKPAAASLADARHILTGIGARQPVDVAYHMAFSPEVTWGLNAVQNPSSEAGDLVSAELFFADPYYDDFDRAQAALCNSWLDSGINALSVLSRFAAITERRSLRSLGTKRQSVFEARLTVQAGSQPVSALVVTSWHVTDAAKTTRLRYASGTELLMDHTAVAAYLYRGGTVEATFGSDRSVTRRERHYRPLYKSWLEGNPTLPPETSLALHELVLA